jgi:hypothetical protein
METYISLIVVFTVAGFITNLLVLNHVSDILEKIKRLEDYVYRKDFED